MGQFEFEDGYYQVDLWNDVLVKLVLEKRRRRQLGGQVEEGRLGDGPIVVLTARHQLLLLLGVNVGG